MNTKDNISVRDIIHDSKTNIFVLHKTEDLGVGQIVGWYIEDKYGNTLQDYNNVTLLDVNGNNLVIEVDFRYDEDQSYQGAYPAKEDELKIISRQQAEDILMEELVRRLGGAIEGATYSFYLDNDGRLYGACAVVKDNKMFAAGSHIDPLVCPDEGKDQPDLLELIEDIESLVETMIEKRHVVDYSKFLRHAAILEM